MDYLKRILGEADEPDHEPNQGEADEPDQEENPEALDTAPEPNAPLESNPLDADVEEMANMWKTGNKRNVVSEFMGMDNETAVKLVFAIGLESALELGRMADEMMEQEEGEPGSEEFLDGEETTAPAEIKPPSGEGAMDDFHDIDYVSKLLGHGHGK